MEEDKTKKKAIETIQFFSRVHIVHLSVVFVNTIIGKMYTEKE